MASEAGNDRDGPVNGHAYEEPGIFTWDLSIDAVYCDSAVARYFDLDEREAAHGLPLGMFMDRMHEDDRKRVAHAIREAVITGEPYREEFRTVHRDGSVMNVLAFGRCFRNQMGEPAHYAGVLCPLPVAPSVPRELAWRCMAAYELAVQEGNEEVAARLLEALRALGVPELRLRAHIF
ncbi:PAS domain-containing protein [Rhizobium sp. LC145]|uniref:PAS domain-containing protein n=1 Tax=Rhizobium sp. LC145 TaxID=1120688 RepID=UPI00069C07FE|nr:PAS domain-containing protein [Rhizobium sp. LC145]TKT60079.1 PAS domain-containing protein [Rhizobiaceae bacterium LC148]